MNEVEAPYLFNETQQALKQASVLHHETFLRYREELNQYEVEIRGLTEKRDSYKLLSEQREGKVKNLQAELEVARKEHPDLVEQVRSIFEVSDNETDTVANGPNLQVQKKLDKIEQFRAEVDAVKVEVEEWKSNMDRLALEKKTARAQLAKKIEKLQSQLNSVVSDLENLANKLETAKSKANAEAAQSAKELEVEAKKLAYPEDDDDFEGLSGSECGGDPEGDEAALGEDQAT
ncbi:PREDICTED: cingulin-like [Nicotiana attenuata]|uniref:cingulin-like n=1 Tax=Nicotiana attenuata TaxID=49451 RepID=UPI00090526F3|nr:PREDICTED: cingulin-like [Nicotiana attenuata]